MRLVDFHDGNILKVLLTKQAGESTRDCIYRFRHSSIRLFHNQEILISSYYSLQVNVSINSQFHQN